MSSLLQKDNQNSFKVIMKTIGLICCCLVITLISACNQSEKNDKNNLEQLHATIKPADINLQDGDTPKYFTAQTIDGSTFNSEELKGQYWVIFMYSLEFMVKSEHFDLVSEINNIAAQHGDKIPMIGIIDGFTDDAIARKKLLDSTKLYIKQIDNTEGPDKEEVVDDDVYCTPAKILINPEGKVIYNGCGGDFEYFSEILTDLIKTHKL